MKKIILISILALAATAAQARDAINIVGSSTVYPFATIVAERFGKTTKFPTPKIESTGSGGGLKLFCAGIGVGHPDIANSSRAIKKAEVDKCASNGVNEIVEVKIGYDGIVIANAKGSDKFDITLRELYLALAKDVPNPDGTHTFVPNPYYNWSEINPALPNVSITVLGPPPTSGTRDAFNELGIEGGAKTYDWVKAIKKEDKKRYKTLTRTVREDGVYVEAGENDNLIVQKIRADHNILGVFGFSFLDQNRDVVQGAFIDGVPPEFETVSDNSYPLSRLLFFYVKKAHIGAIPGIQEYTSSFVSKQAIGEEGYLTDRGLIPLPEDEYNTVVETIRNMTPMQ